MSRSLRIKPVAQVKGELELPGDKSISHRVAMLASIANGDSRIRGFATSADCLSTLDCLSRLGVQIERREREIVIHGVGLRGYRATHDPVDLDVGNSGSTIRMLAGILAAQNLTTILDGDNSLRGRPMRRIIEPLNMMGARIEARESSYPPLCIHGAQLEAIDYQSPVASAQVKSCVLLAGLNAKGTTSVAEPARSRNHTELMLEEFGASITVNADEKTVSVEGGQQLKGIRYTVPGDISSAAFFIAAASIIPDSRVALRDVCLNPTRIAFLDVLERLGASIERRNLREQHGEIVGDLVVSSDQLKTDKGGLILSGKVIPNLIDELPILAVVATQTRGRTEVRDARELRVKESDRIRSIVEAIRSLGGEIEEYDDGFAVCGPERLTGGRVETNGDHRIAMAMAIAALIAQGPTEIVGADCANVSFPEFFHSLQKISGGAALE